MSQGGYESISGTGAESYKPIDPTGAGEQYNQLLYSGLPGAMTSLTNGIDQNALMNQYLNQFGQLQGATTDATSGLSQQLQQQVTDLTNRATTDVGRQFSGLNSLYSSGMSQAAGEAAGNIASNAGVQLAQSQLGLLSPLAQQAYGGLQSSAQQNQSNMLGLLGLGQQQFAPTYASEQYSYQPSTMENIMQYAGGIGNLVGGVASMFL